MLWINRIYNPIVLILSPTDATANTVLINSSLTSSRASARAVYVSPGVWPYDGEVWVNSTTLCGESDSILIGSDGTETPECAVFLTGYCPRLFGLSLVSESSARGNTNYHNGVTINFAKGAKVVGTITKNAAAYGVGNFGSIGSTIQGVSVLDSGADGIHNTYGSSDSEVSYCSVSGCGDDYYPVVSYLNDPDVTTNILIRDSVGDLQSAPGRGLVVDGGINITFRRMVVRNVQERGIYLSTEDEFITSSMIGVLLEDILVDGCGLNGIDADEPGAAGIWVGKQSSRECRDVSTKNVVIKNATGPATYNWQGRASNIDFSGVSIA